MAKILLVGKRTETGRALSAMLDEMGHDVSSLPDAHAAIAAVQQVPVDAVVIETKSISTGGLSELELLRNSSEMPAIPILIAADTANSDQRRRAISLGAADVVSDTWSEVEIELRLDWILKSKDRSPRAMRVEMTTLSPVTA